MPNYKLGAYIKLSYSPCGHLIYLLFKFERLRIISLNIPWAVDSLTLNRLLTLLNVSFSLAIIQRVNNNFKSCLSEDCPRQWVLFGNSSNTCYNKLQI